MTGWFSEIEHKMLVYRLNVWLLFGCFYENWVISTSKEKARNERSAYFVENKCVD